MILTTLLYSFSETSQLLFNLATGLIVFLLITYVLPAIQRFRSLPPGPWGLPFVGYLPFIAKTDQYKDIDQLAKTYGPVYSMQMGKYTVIVVSDWEHVKDALVNDDLLDRPMNTSANHKAPSILEMSGETWRSHRDLLLHIVRDVGLGKTALEVKVKQEIENFLPTLANGPIDLYPKLLSTVSNNISNLLMGHGLDYDDPINKKLTDILISLGRTSSLFPVFTPKSTMFGSSDSPTEMLETLKTLTEFASYMESEIELHKSKGRSYLGAFEDYIGGYLAEQRKRQKSDESDSFNSDTLRQNLVSFYAAGTETISATLSWAIIYLIEYPEYLGKIREEIEMVIGYEREPDYSDRLKMPFTMSFIYEVHRFASIMPINLFRRASRDTKIGSYNVPKDTLVMFNFYAIHRDPLLWFHPEQFDPKRFLAEHETKSVKPPFLVPFSGGRRVCPGEDLASVELFLYLVNIVRNYQIKMAPGFEMSLEEEYGTVKRPANIPKLIFEKYRQQTD